MKRMKKIFVILLLLAGGRAAAQTEGVSAVKKLSIQPSFSEYAKAYVEQRVNQWQKKGEFEKSADWQVRVNEQTRREKIAELTKEAEREFIARCSAAIAPACTLGDYDADNEVYLITDARFGNLLVPVPLSEAPAFKSGWASLRITPEYFVENDRLALAAASFALPGSKSYRYSNRASLEYMVADVDYNFDPIEIDVADNSDRRGRQTISQTKLTVGKSDVDVDIPQIKEVNDKTFAVIIANENYDREAQVDFALNDGETFRKYCRMTLGVPESNIRYVADATLNNMRGEINWLCKVAEAHQGEAEILFYYAGHGIPDERTSSAYLLPTDGYGSDVETGYKLSELYDRFGRIPARSVTVFLDACFSGAQRSGEMLASARGVAIKVRDDAPSGNTVVFSAASSDETAYPYREKGHGLFTYFLLKKLQSSAGDVTLGELGDYITTNVSRQSIVVNNKSQTPKPIPSPILSGSWENLKLR